MKILQFLVAIIIAVFVIKTFIYIMGVEDKTEPPVYFNAGIPLPTPNPGPSKPN